jgi:hypothetical protein
MSEQAFDNAVMNSAARETNARAGTPYSEWGESNSNNFVYSTLKGAGAKVPAEAQQGKSAPGICGGSSDKNGTDCAAPKSRKAP